VEGEVMMKHLVFASVLCIPGVARADVPTHLPTITELVQVCSSTNVVNQATTANPPTEMQRWEAMYCMGFFAAVVSMNAGAICPPEGTSFAKSVQVLLKWVRANPEVLNPQRQLPAWSSVMTSLLNEWPCRPK
jgi:hypothetical protein